MYELPLPVQIVSQPIGEFFITSISAQDLVSIAYADVRRLSAQSRDIEKYLGIQRPLSPKRVKEIKQYIMGNDATFPTAIIVAVDERCASYEPLSDFNGTLTLSPFVPEPNSDEVEIPWEKIAKVLDGQHRIAAFMDEKKQYSFSFEEDFEINLAIFVGADISEQASIFATVNLAQTKVNKSLVYDLTELAKTRSPQKTCHNVAVALDSQSKSPFYQRVKRLGVRTPGRSKEPLTQAAFVESLLQFISSDPVQDRNILLDKRKLSPVTPDELRNLPFRNLFINGQDLDIAEILFNYFSAVRDKWPSSWDDVGATGNLLPRSNAFKALMKFLREDVYASARAGHGEIPSVKVFSGYFKNIDVIDKDFTSRNFVPGGGGQSTFLKMLRQEITRDDMFE